MLKSFKTEINPTEEQKVKIRKTIGTCRYIYNFYLAHNKELHDNGEKFMSGKSFSVWLNNEYLPQNPDKLWIKEVSSKSVKRSIENGCVAFTRFFKHQSAFPNFKKKGKSDVKMYFVKNNPKDCRCERHRMNIPSLGWVRMKEKGYFPTTKDGYVIKSGHVSIKADRYIDNNLVFCSSNGRPMESQVINRAFNKLIKENGLPHVVFHSLRHSSITYKLKLNGGDMKSVQGDSGHAQVKMVADVYSHIIDEDRCINAQRLEEAFYSSKTPDPVEDTEPKTADTAVTESDAAKILELLKNPETAALLKQLAKAL